MKIISYILILTFFYSGCRNSIKSEKENYCEYNKKLALKEIEKGNLSPSLKGKYLYSNVEKYYIWKKYGVNIIYPIDLHEYRQIEIDSCFNSVMLEQILNKTEIIRDLDSLTTIKGKTEYNYPISKYIKQYHDGIYFVGVDANNKDLAPKRIDTTYYDQLEEFKERLSLNTCDTVKCEFWYEIDTLGNVSNVDIYHHASSMIDSVVIKFYKSFKYIPANDGTKKLKYRNNDFISILGVAEKTTCQHKL